MHLQNAAATPLTVTLIGSEGPGGRRGHVLGLGDPRLQPGRGHFLSGGTVTADLSSPTPMTLTLALQVGQNTGALSGTATGTVRQGDGDGSHR